MDVLASTAFSLTLAGNSGISPFLTMLLIGIAERLSPDRFHMSDVMETVASSWPSLCFWTVLTVLEYVGKCVPVIDQIVDGFEVLIVPVLVCVLRLHCVMCVLCVACVRWVCCRDDCFMFHL